MNKAKEHFIALCKMANVDAEKATIKSRSGRRIKNFANICRVLIQIGGYSNADLGFLNMDRTSLTRHRGEMKRHYRKSTGEQSKGQNPLEYEGFVVKYKAQIDEIFNK